MTITIKSSEETLRLSGPLKHFSRAAMGVEVVLGSAKISTTEDCTLYCEDKETTILLDPALRATLDNPQYHVGSEVRFKLTREGPDQYKIDGLVPQRFR